MGTQPAPESPSHMDVFQRQILALAISAICIPAAVSDVLHPADGEALNCRDLPNVRCSFLADAKAHEQVGTNQRCPSSSELLRYERSNSAQCQSNALCKANTGEVHWCKEQCADTDGCTHYGHWSMDNQRLNKVKGRCSLYSACETLQELGEGLNNVVFKMEGVVAKSPKVLSPDQPLEAPCNNMVLNHPEFQAALSERFGEGHLLFLGDNTTFVDAVTLHFWMSGEAEKPIPEHPTELSTLYLSKFQDHSFISQWDKMETVDELLKFAQLLNESAPPTDPAKLQSLIPGTQEPEATISIIKSTKIIIYSVPIAEIASCEPDDLNTSPKALQDCPAMTKLAEATKLLCDQPGFTFFLRETLPIDQGKGCCAQNTQYCPEDRSQTLLAKWCSNDFVMHWNKLMLDSISIPYGITQFPVFEHAYKSNKAVNYETDSTGFHFSQEGRQNNLVQQLGRMCSQVPNLPKHTKSNQK